MIQDNKVIIRLNINDYEDRNGYISTLEDDLAEKILDRIRKYDKLLKEKNFNSEKDIYLATKRHDSIHIDGVRGSGKSTIIKYIKEYDKNEELQNSVEFLSPIDPNQLDKNTNIIDIVTDLIYKTIKENNDKKIHYHSDALKKNKFDQLSSLKERIDDLTFKTFKKDYETSVIRQDVTREERILDFTFHEFAKLACELFNKKALILPIDDIDMRLDVGINILETIRKYFQTPHLIPIIALDSTQAYALVKKQFFETFDYKSNTNHNEIDTRSGMSFLKKLPSEYLQKILPPSQRVAIYDMLDYYKDEYNYQNGKLEQDNQKAYKAVFFLKNVKGKNGKGEDIILSFKDMLKLLMNVIFDYVDYNDDYSPDDYHIINYLENKSFRSFLDDARALMRGLNIDNNFIYEGKKTTVYKLNTRYLKIRFQLYSKNAASNKYDGARWFWSKYIENIYSELEKVAKRDNDEKSYYINLDMINDIFVVEPKDTSSLGRKEKIYYRLFIKEFFIKDTFVEFKKQNDNIYKVNQVIKEYDIQGYLEFIIRILFPASIFELLVNNRLISILKFPLERLQDFASPNSKATLAELYGEWFPFWTILYPYSDDFDEYKDNVLAVKIIEKQNQPFRKNPLIFTVEHDFVFGEQNLYVHPFKALAYISEIKVSENKNEFYFDYMPKGYINQEGGQLKSLKAKTTNCIKQISNTTKNYISDKLLILGIISSIKYVKDLSTNILFTFLYKPKKLQNIFYSKLEKLGLNEDSIKILYKIELQKNLSSIYASYINLLLKILLENGYYFKSNKEVKFDIDKNLLISGFKESNILLPLIVDDPFLRNLELLEKSNIINKKAIIEFIKFYCCILNLNRYYFPVTAKISHKICNFNKTNNAIKQLSNNIEIENAYIDLFTNFIMKYKYIKNDFLDINNDESLEDTIKAFIEKLKREKKNNIEDNYLYENIKILLKDALNPDFNNIKDIEDRIKKIKEKIEELEKGSK